MKEELSSQQRETLFLLSTNMADVTAAENQQFPAIVTIFEFETKAKKKDLGRVPRGLKRAGNGHYNPICVGAICILSYVDSTRYCQGYEATAFVLRIRQLR